MLGGRVGEIPGGQPVHPGLGDAGDWLWHGDQHRGSDLEVAAPAGLSRRHRLFRVFRHFLLVHWRCHHCDDDCGALHLQPIR